MSANSGRQRALDAVDVLNDFIGDFVTAERTFQYFAAQLRQGVIGLPMFVPVQRMCISHIALAFSKFEEFWTHYHDLVAETHRQPCKDILREIRERKITEFRNRCVGHIWNKETKRPLTNSEVMAALERMSRGDFNGFLRWVNTPPNNNYPVTVVAVVEAVRDDICKDHGIQPQEAIER